MGEVVHPKPFPQCPAPAELCQQFPSAANGYSLNTVSLAAAMYAYWVPRLWKVSIGVTQTEPPGSQPVIYDFIFGSTAEKEEDLVCEPLWESKSGNQGWVQAEFSFFWNFINPAPLCGAIPSYRVYAGGSFSQNAEANDDIIEFGGSLSNEPTSEIGIAAGPYSFRYPFWQASAVPNSGPYYQTYTSFNIEAISYWSYGGTWDTETGMPL